MQSSCSSAYNLSPYDANGRPLTGVRLYDQDGQPFDVSGVSCGQPGYGPFVDAGSQPGAYPYPTSTPADEAYPTGPPASLAPLPGATVSSSGTGTSGPTGTPSPAATPTNR